MSTVPGLGARLVAMSIQLVSDGIHGFSPAAP